MKTKKTTKQQAILDYLAKSPHSTPVEVAKALRSLGVTANYVSNIKCLHKKSKKKGEHRPDPTKPSGSGNNNGGTGASACRTSLAANGMSPVYASKLAVDIVLQARELANRCGGCSELRKLLDAMQPGD